MSISYAPAKIKQARKKAREWGMHVPKEGAHGFDVHIVHGVVSDPNPARNGQDQLVAVNIRHSALENEWSRRRISLAAYMAGRTYQGTFDEGESSPAFSERIKVLVTSGDAFIVRALDQARNIVALRDDARNILGKDREQLLNKILCENKGIEEIAVSLYGSGSLNTTFTGKTFRASLELLGKEWFCT